jgi:glycine cleavage system T protein
MPEAARSPLADLHRAQGVSMGVYHGAEVPLRFSEAQTEHRAVRNAAGFFDFAHRAGFGARGADHAAFLHNMLSNDIKGVAAGQGIYATLLDVKGHILADLRVYRDQNQILLDTDADLRARAMQTLERYIVMDDVVLQPLDTFAIGFQGPRSRGFIEKTLARVEKTLSGNLAELAKEYDHKLATLPGGETIRLLRASSTGEDGYELWAPAAIFPRLWEAARDEAESCDALPCGAEALESLRIEAGIPAYGAELGEDTLPLEAGILHALSFTKGCYIGQEIVERARSRGHVNWKLVGLFVDAPRRPAPGEQLLSQGNQVGEITSSCVSPTLGRTLALGYVRREVSEAGTRLALASGAPADVATLPFYHRIQTRA